MICEKIRIEIPGEKDAAQLYTYFLDSSPEIDGERIRPVIVICPGGGYRKTSDREAEPVAMQFLAMGYHAVILRYSVAPAVYPTALLQLAWTVYWLKEHASVYHIDKSRIVLLGFSAGAHLASCLGVFWNRLFLRERLQIQEAEMLRPAGMILSYPVITSGEKAHRDSFDKLLGVRSRDPRLLELLSLEKQVSEDTPPVFLWHTQTDPTVPVENSLLFYQALLAHGVSAEMHLYPVGGHGLSLASEETINTRGYGVQVQCQSWIRLAGDWMRQTLFPEN